MLSFGIWSDSNSDVGSLSIDASLRQHDIRKNLGSGAIPILFPAITSRTFVHYLRGYFGTGEEAALGAVEVFFVFWEGLRGGK